MNTTGADRRNVRIVPARSDSRTGKPIWQLHRVSLTVVLRRDPVGFETHSRALARMRKPLTALVSLVLCLLRLDSTLCSDGFRSGGMIPRGSQTSLEPWHDIGNLKTLEGWKGLAPSDDGAVLSIPGEARFSRTSVNDWSEYFGLRLDVIIPEGRIFEGEIVLRTPPLTAKSSYRSSSSTTRAAFSIAGSGAETIEIPFTAFDHYYPFLETFYAIQKISIRGKFAGGEPGRIILQRVRVIQAPRLKLYSASRSRVGEENETVEYRLEVLNCSDRPQAVVLSHSPYSKHVMRATISPRKVLLEPGETSSCEVRVNVTDRVPPGGRERQKIVAIANGGRGGELELITGRKLPHPYLVHTPERWDAIRKKVEEHEWAKEELKRYTDFKPHNNRPESYWPFAVAWQITRDRAYAERARRGISAEESGKHLIQAAEIYDMIQDSGVLSKEEQTRIEDAFRERMRHVRLSGVANLELQEARCGFTLALAVQDFAWFEHFLHASDGVYDNIANGIMPDGWWYEGSVNYNVWVSRYICKMALAAEPFGVNLIDHYFTPGYSKEFRRLPEDVETRKREHGGKPFQKFGKHPKPVITLDMLWDSFLHHVAHDGWMFAANDAGEWTFTDGEAFELAYMMYRKPEYASLIKYSGGRNLLYGVPELPEDTPEIGRRSVYSDGIGFITLRSQTPGRAPADQIATTLKYGTHGAYHGHFDRTNFNSLKRHDRSFYMSGHGLWYSYASFMYGFFVQSSMNHNMVVVDSKNQEPVESRRLLFHSSQKMQVAAVETNARWCNPPYMGLQMRRQNRKPEETPVYSGAERARLEDVHVPIPDPEPEPASIGEYSERVLQRRLMVVTDDYVVLADYLRGDDPHVFDNLLQIRGFQEITGGGVRFFRHTDQMGTDPTLPAQLITDCAWYTKNGTSKAEFVTIYDDRSHLNWRSLRGKRGKLHMDVYSAWPPRAELMVGAAPELRGRIGYTEYRVLVDGEVSATGQFSPWILGREEIDISLESCKVIELQTRSEDRRGHGGFVNTRVDGLFWAGGQIETADGTEIKLSDLEARGKIAFDGIRRKTDAGDPVVTGKDYRGGEVIIQGRHFKETLPAQPKGNGLIAIDLTGLDAVRFRISLGADYPYGVDVLDYQRRVYSARVKGTSARFLTVIEPFEKGPLVRKVTARSADHLRVELENGRVQEIEIAGFEGSGETVDVRLTESRDGRVIHEESTMKP